MYTAGAAVGLGAAAVGGATVAGRTVMDKGVDAGRGTVHVVSKVGGSSCLSSDVFADVPIYRALQLLGPVGCNAMCSSSLGKVAGTR